MATKPKAKPEIENASQRLPRDVATPKATEHESINK